MNLKEIKKKIRAKSRTVILLSERKPKGLSLVPSDKHLAPIPYVKVSDVMTILERWEGELIEKCLKNRGVVILETTITIGEIIGKRESP